MPGGGKTTAVDAIRDLLARRGIETVTCHIGRFDGREIARTAWYLLRRPCHWRRLVSLRSRRALVQLGSFLRRELRRRELVDGDHRLVLMDEGPVNGAAMLAAAGGPRIPITLEPDVMVLVDVSPEVAAERTRQRGLTDPTALVSSVGYLVHFAEHLEEVVGTLTCPILRTEEDDHVAERLADTLEQLFRDEPKGPPTLN